MPIIRRAEARDLPALAALAAKLFSGEEAELLAEFAQLLPCPDAALFLCEEGGAGVGFAQAQLRRDYVEGTSTSPVGYLEGIYVEPGFRRRGLARLLLSRAIAYARAAGAFCMTLEVRESNTPAIALYRSFGFVPVGLRPRYYHDPEENALLMTLLLSEEDA